MHCAMHSVDDVSLITMVWLKSVTQAGLLDSIKDKRILKGTGEAPQMIWQKNSLRLGLIVIKHAATGV